MNNQFFDNDGVPREALRGLLDLFDLTHDGSLADILRVTQAAWYKEGKLRVDIDEEHGHKREAAMPFLRQLGLVDEISATQSRNEMAIVLGAVKSAIRKRYAILIREYRQGVRFRSLVMCGSARPSNEVVTDFANEFLPFPENTSFAGYENPPPDETDLMEAIYQLARPTFPWNRDIIPLFKKTTVQGRHANTRDTLTDWGTFPTGKILLVSSQPFVSFQLMIARQCLPGCQIDAIGPAASPTLAISKFLDNAAKIIFELAD